VLIPSIGKLPLDVVYLLDVNADLLLQTQHVPQREHNTSRCSFISSASGYTSQRLTRLLPQEHVSIKA
jgi:hypothetical protein